MARLVASVASSRNDATKPWRWGAFAASPLIATCSLVMLAIAIAPLDSVLASVLRADHWPRALKEVRRLIEFAEVFAAASGVVAIVLVAAALDRRGWGVIPRALTCALGAGLLADLGKCLVARMRPRAFDLSQSPWTSFHDWAPFARGIDDPTWTSDWQSMPSGHTATAVGLAIALSRLYPRGSWCFATLAFLAATQRVVSSAHFPSDTLVGAAIAVAWVAALERNDWVRGRWLSWESPAA